MSLPEGTLRSNIDGTNTSLGRRLVKGQYRIILVGTAHHCTWFCWDSNHLKKKTPEAFKKVIKRKNEIKQSPDSFGWNDFREANSTPLLNWGFNPSQLGPWINQHINGTKSTRTALELLSNVRVRAWPHHPGQTDPRTTDGRRSSPKKGVDYFDEENTELEQKTSKNFRKNVFLFGVE